MDAENISSILFMLKKEKGKRTKGEGRGVTPDDRNQLFKVQKKRDWLDVFPRISYNSSTKLCSR